MQALLLAGGLGSRLRAHTKDTPKPMLRVNGKPFIDYVIWNLRRYGIREIILSIGYLPEQFKEYFASGEQHGMRLKYSIEPEPLGTGGAVRYAFEQKLIDSDCLVLNGDTILDVNYFELPAAAADRKCAATMALRTVPDATRYGQVVFRNGVVHEFNEKQPHADGKTAWINAGVYWFSANGLGHLPKGRSSLEHDFLPDLAQRGQLAGHTTDGFFLDIGIPETLEQASTLVPRWLSKKAVFLDRDGVVNQELGYVHTREQWKWMEGAQAAIRLLNNRGYLVFLVTNQSGIARGYYSEAQFLELMNWVRDELSVHAAHIDTVYYCPHHPEGFVDAYRKECDCRKPNPGLIDRGMREWALSPANCVLLGDKTCDIEAANAAGIRSFRFSGGNLLDFVIKHIA